MAYAKGIASPSSSLSWTFDDDLYSDGVVTPTGRTMASGSKAVLITALEGFASGRGASVSMRLRLGSAVTGWFTRPASSSAGYTGSHATNHYLVAGGSVRFTYEWDGSPAIYFGRGGSGTNVHSTSTAGAWGGTLAGAMYYVQAPTAPSGLTLSSDSARSVTASWKAPSDNGGTGITGYQLQYSTSSSFSGATVVNLSSTTSYTVEDLTDGETYYFRVAAKNAVTSAAGTTSVWSARASISVASSGTLIAGIPPTFSENPGAFWSLAGHNVGFNESGDIVRLEEAAVTFTYYNPVTSQDEQSTTVVRTNAAWTTQYTVIAEKMYATYTLGDSLLGIVGPDGLSSVQMIAFKTNLNGADMSILWQGRPVNSALGTGQLVEVSVDYLAQTFTVSASYRSGGFVVPATSVVDISTLDLTAELAVYVTYKWNTLTKQYTLYASIREANSYSASLGATLNYTADGLDLYTDPWEISGNARALVTSNMLSGPAMNDLHEWENSPSYVIEGELPMDGPIVAYNGNVWEYIQMVASASACEYASSGENIVVRPVGTRVLDVTNIVGSPTISPQSLMTGRIVEVNYSNAEPVNLGTIYDASTEEDRTFTINSNEIRVEAVSTRASLQTVIQPSPTGTYPNPAGTYYVTDSEDQVVSPVDWVASGGAVSVAVDPESAEVIQVTITGPAADISGSPGPYTIGTKVNSIAKGTLKVVGSGLYTNVKTLSLLTGADPDKTPQLVATTINNPAIANLESAYDRGIWASLLATVRLTLTGTLPLSAVTGFGLTAGSLVQYADNIYRITDVSIRNIDVSFTAEVHCTSNDYSARWADKTVADHDAHWFGYDVQDERIIPLR